MKSLLFKIEYIEYFILFLFSLGVLNMSSYWILFLFVVTFLFKYSKKIYITSDLCILTVLFTVFYFLYSFFYEEKIMLFSMIALFIGPVMGFLIGQKMIAGNEHVLKNVIFIVSGSNLIHGILNLIKTPKAEIWFEQNIMDIWTGSKVTATLNGAFFTGAIVLFCWLLFKKGAINKIFSICMVAIIVWSSTKTAERTLILNFILTLIVYLGGKVIFEKSKHKALLRCIKYFLIVLGALVVLVVVFVNDIGGIQTLFLETSLGKRLTMLDSLMQDGRSSASREVLNALWKNPFGHYGDMFYAHNLVIDIGRLCGIIPMSIMVIYLIRILIRLFKLCKNQHMTFDIRLITFVFYFAYLVNFMLEPVLEGMPMMFIAFCIVNGGVASFTCNDIYKNKIKITNE